MDDTWHLCYGSGGFYRASDKYYFKESVVIYNVPYCMILRFNRTFYHGTNGTRYYEELFDSVEIVKVYEGYCSTPRLERDTRRLQSGNPLWRYVPL